MTRQLEHLSERDEAVLQSVGQLRLVTGLQLQRLCFSGSEASSQNPRIARRCLQRLTDHRYLWRATRRVGGLRAGSASYIYGLGARSTPGRSQRAEPSLTFVRHQLAVAEVYVRLHEARKSGELAELLIETEPSCWRVIEDGSGSTLKPDLFVVASTAASDHLAFVEVDNGTEHAAAIDRKTALYRAYWQSGREQERQGVFPVVLWQAEAPERRADLQRLLKRSEASRLHLVVKPAQTVAWLCGASSERTGLPGSE